jgi:hypothetical protein
VTRGGGAVISALLTAGCGYVGESLPPLLHIPTRVSDLAAVQRGSSIIVQFSIPQLTTEGVALKKPPRLDLRAGEAQGAFNAETWAAGAKLIPVSAGEPRARLETAAAEWAGKEIIFGVRAFGPSGRESGWSNFVTLHVIPPLRTPSDLRAQAVPDGVRLAWSGPASEFRVFRRAGEEKAFSMVATVKQTEWTDATTEYGARYTYLVQAVSDAAESEFSNEAPIVPRDEFPPAVPAGLAAVLSVQSIELAWDRNTEPDLAGYRLYRSESGGPFQLLAETQKTPSYSDRKIESGKPYRYAVSAVDQAGNESARTAPVEVTAP